MKHKKLSTPPITYVIAQVKFTSIELIQNYIPEIQDKLRHDFPFNEKISIQIFEMREGEQPNPSLINQWHFKDKEFKNGIMIDAKSIAIHSSSHAEFKELVKKFQNVLDLVNNVLNISLTLRIGVRYINIIDSNIDDYVNKSLLGFKLREKNFDQNAYQIISELNQKTDEGAIKIKAIRTRKDFSIFKDIKIYAPMDLQNSASLLSFAHQKSLNDEFMMLDLDHSSVGQEDFNVERVIKKMTDLQHDIYLAFTETVTEKALQAWE